jgi:hypothetical protein
MLPANGARASQEAVRAKHKLLAKEKHFFHNQ